MSWWRGTNRSPWLVSLLLISTFWKSLSHLLERNKICLFWRRWNSTSLPGTIVYMYCHPLKPALVYNAERGKSTIMLCHHAYATMECPSPNRYRSSSYLNGVLSPPQILYWFSFSWTRVLKKAVGGFYKMYFHKPCSTGSAASSFKLDVAGVYIVQVIL